MTAEQFAGLLKSKFIEPVKVKFECDTPLFVWKNLRRRKRKRYDEIA